MNKNIFKIGLLFISISSISLNSCKHEVDLTGIPEISFSTDIQLILSGNCTMSGCHGTDAQSEFSLTTYNDVINNGDVSKGNANNSDLYKVLLEEGEDRMPPTGPLTDLQIKKVYLWIEQGAKDN
jgi:Planctomycete cytochrome C